ncbi:MAG: HAD family phosphatase [Prevotella sp.]|nr:HAD family phosphatase [Prevotella sp.]
MIKNIIFDFGGVIVTISHDEAVRRFTELGLPDAEKWLDPYTQTGIFGQLEEGLVTAEDFRIELSRLCGRELSFEECKYAWLGYRADVPRRNLEVLKKLREQGYRLILLSNTNPYMMSWAESGDFDGEGHSIHDYFDATYLSFQLKVMKPNPTFFSKVLMAEQVSPEECLFLDDGPCNVAAASEMGIRTFRPDNGADWTREIFDYLK